MYILLCVSQAGLKEIRASLRLNQLSKAVVIAVFYVCAGLLVDIKQIHISLGHRTGQMGTDLICIPRRTKGFDRNVIVLIESVMRHILAHA